MAEQATHNRLAGGSSPSGRTKWGCGGMADAADLKSAAIRREGSSPSSPTNYISVREKGKQMAENGMPEVGEKFYKYYFFFDGETSTYRRTRLTITKVVGNMVYFSEEFEDGESRNSHKFVHNDDDFANKVFTFGRGAAVISKGNKAKAKKLVATYYQEKASAADLMAEAAFAKMRAVQKA